MNTCCCKTVKVPQCHVNRLLYHMRYAKLINCGTPLGARRLDLIAAEQIINLRKN